MAHPEADSNVEQERLLLFTLKIFLMIVFLAFSLLARSPLYGALFLYSFASLVFRWGWLIPCVLAGLLVGMSFQSPVVSVSLESHLWEMAGLMCRGFVGGFVVGCLIDFADPNPFVLGPHQRETRSTSFESGTKVKEIDRRSLNDEEL